MKNDPPPKYNIEVVEAVILEIAAELHPEHLPTRELISKIVSDLDDEREVETASQAVRRLKELGLIRERDDEVVEPTRATLHVVALLTS